MEECRTRQMDFETPLRRGSPQASMPFGGLKAAATEEVRAAIRDFGTSYSPRAPHFLVSGNLESKLDGMDPRLRGGDKAGIETLVNLLNIGINAFLFA
jgi:hypothetical protein